MSIKYHGTPISGQRLAVNRFLTKRHALVNFFRPDDLESALKYCVSVIFDTGAFSLFNQGGGSYDEYYPGYIEWVRQYHRHPRFAWCIIPDYIGGTEEENGHYLSLWPEDLKHVGVPVWHMNESLNRLRTLCQHYPRVAIAPGAFKGNVTPRLDEAMEVICDENGQPIAKLHGLKLQNPKVFTRYPFSSTDSTNVAQNISLNLAKGKQPTDELCADDIANKIEVFNSAGKWDRTGQSRFDFFAEMVA